MASSLHHRNYPAIQLPTLPPAL